MNTLQAFGITAASLTVGLWVLETAPAQAAVLTYDFEVGGTVNETGFFSFDDSALTGGSFEFLTVSDLEFNFGGSVFTEEDGFTAPQADFLDGQFVGLTFDVLKDDTAFNFLSGFSGADGTVEGAVFLNGGEVSPVTYTLREEDDTASVPEPAATAALGLLGLGWLLKQRWNVAA